MNRRVKRRLKTTIGVLNEMAAGDNQSYDDIQQIIVNLGVICALLVSIAFGLILTVPVRFHPAGRSGTRHSG
jgi:hypothetical protein